MRKKSKKVLFFGKKRVKTQKICKKGLTNAVLTATTPLRYCIDYRTRLDQMKKIPFKSIKPKDVSDEVWTCVVEAWENGLSDREAALIVTRKTDEEIRPSDIAKWKKENPEVAELQAFLEVSLRSDAKLNISDAIRSGKTKVSQWYLERKAPDEFSTKSAVAFEGAVVELSLEEKERALKNLVETFGDGE